MSYSSLVQLTGSKALDGLALLAAIVACAAVQRYWKLRHVPGPILAKWTDLYRMGIVKTKVSHEIYARAHEKYGPVVRMGPNMVSVADPIAIPTVYPMRPGFPKAAFYDAFIPYTKGASPPAIFTARDESLHKQLKSPVAPLYSLSSVLKYEPFVDEVLSVLFEKMDARMLNSSHKTVDLGAWLQYFAFDTMGTMTFSEKYGFLESGNDSCGILDTIWAFMLTVGPMTQAPWLDKLLNKNWIAAGMKKGSGNVILSIAAENVQKRRQGLAAGSDKNEDDFLSKFLKIEAETTDMPPWFPLVWTFSNIIAGSDSTAVVMKTAMYHILAHPQSYSKLSEELMSLPQSTETGALFPQWSEIGALPYLDACVNEAARIHPPFCLALERVVPEGGVTVSGVYLPAGTVVGMNPYVVNRDCKTFGDDADSWRPERWLEGDEEHRRGLAQSIMTFGAGRRVCLGKHVAILEIKKAIAALLLNYKLRLVDAKAYRTENSYFFRQHGIEVEIISRR